MRTLVEIGYTKMLLAEGENPSAFLVALAGAEFVESKGYGSNITYKLEKNQPEIKFCLVPDNQLASDASYDPGTTKLVECLEKDARESTSAKYKSQNKAEKAKEQLEAVVAILKSEQPASQTKEQMVEQIANALAAGQQADEATDV